MMLSYIVLISNCLRKETACLRPACHTVLTRIMYDAILHRPHLKLFEGRTACLGPACHIVLNRIMYDAILHRPHLKLIEGRNCLFKASMPHSFDKDNVV